MSPEILDSTIDLTAFLMGSFYFCFALSQIDQFLLGKSSTSFSRKVSDLLRTLASWAWRMSWRRGLGLSFVPSLPFFLWICCPSLMTLLLIRSRLAS